MTAVHIASKADAETSSKLHDRIVQGACWCDAFNQGGVQQLEGRNHSLLTLFISAQVLLVQETRDETRSRKLPEDTPKCKAIPQA